jgi:pyruvate dehydrogenase E1 component alpha subunit
MSDPGVTYRTKEEISEVRQTRDPVEVAKNMIVEAGWAEMAELK